MFDLSLFFGSRSQRLTLLTAETITVNFVESPLPPAIDHDTKPFWPTLPERQLAPPLPERPLPWILEKLQAESMNKDFVWNPSSDTQRDGLKLFQLLMSRSKNHQGMCLT